MSQALFEALSNMDAEEGTSVKNKLVWDTLRDCLDDDIRTEAGQLASALKAAQKKNGVHSPKVGELMAAEILAKVGMLLNEKEEASGPTVEGMA